jgi:protein involved in polysaccharide export with SLBB domain
MRRMMLYLTGMVLLTTPALLAQATPPAAADTGDFRVGDRIELTVQGEDKLSGTFTVMPGPALDLPQIGTLSLVGVRRSGLEAYLRQAVGRFIRDPNVRATSTIRIGVVGQVQKPGFYYVPAAASLTDVLIAAGGPMQGAAVNKMKLTRAGTTTVPDDALRSALSRDLTLAQLGVRSGDQLVMPQADTGGKLTRILAVVVALPAIFLAIRAFR